VDLRRASLALVALVIACGEATTAPAEPGSDTSDTSETAADTTGETGDAPPADLPADLPAAQSESETGEDCSPLPCPEPLTAEAGFVALEGVDYELGLGADAIPLSSTDSRQFWAFQPADVAAEDAPLFVFFNGGPGVSSGMLLGLSTGRRSFAPPLTGPDLELVDNPHSWTTLGNLLWIDARQTGFSYGLLDDPSDSDARAAAMSVASFNSYRDAADFVRTLLRFLAAHPSLRDNEVVLVAESYGGIRAQIMLDMLLQPGAYADGSRRLRDSALFAEIQAHHEAVHGLVEGPQTIAGQFGRQVLIQPSLTGSVQQATAGELFEQPGSVIEQLALELGVDYPSCAELGPPCDPFDHALSFVGQQGRSAYDTRAPYSWLDDLFTLVGARLNDSSTTQELLGVEASAILGLVASERVGAWRGVNVDNFPSDALLGDWPEVGGELESWDRYFATFNIEALSQFRSYTARTLELDPLDAHYGELFLSNLVWVETLVTEAAYDLVIHTPAIPAALASYDSILTGVIVDPDAQEWTLEYREDVFGGPGARVVSVPRYEASHAVSLDEPAKLREDVALWLLE
jgi:hypothetical protein